MKRLEIAAIFIIAFHLMFEQNCGAMIQKRDGSDRQENGSSKLANRVKRAAAVSYFWNSKRCHL